MRSYIMLPCHAPYHGVRPHTLLPCITSCCVMHHTVLPCIIQGRYTSFCPAMHHTMVSDIIVCFHFSYYAAVHHTMLPCVIRNHAVLHHSKVCAKVLSRLWSCSGQVSVSRIPIKIRRTTKDDEEKKRAKGFQGFLYGTSGGRNSKGSSPGPPGRKNKNKNFKEIKTGTYH